MSQYLYLSCTVEDFLQIFPCIELASPQTSLIQDTYLDSNILMIPKDNMSNQDGSERASLLLVALNIENAL